MFFGVAVVDEMSIRPGRAFLRPWRPASWAVFTSARAPPDTLRPPRTDMWPYRRASRFVNHLGRG